MKIGYGRVSTRDQSPADQLDALAAAGCAQVFIDKASASWPARPELDKALMVAREGDHLVVTELGRLGRSLEHLVGLSNSLQERGVDLAVLDQGIDTSTAVGRMFFQILGAIAEFEARPDVRARWTGWPSPGRGAVPAGRSPSSPPTGTHRPGDVRRDRSGWQAPLYRGAGRRRVRRHPPHHLPPPRMSGVSLTGLLVAAVVSALVALCVEWLAKPRLEARKEMILGRYRARAVLLAAARACRVCLTE